MPKILAVGGKIIGGVLIAVSLFTGLIDIYDWLFTSKGKLEASIIAYDYPLPSKVKESYNRLAINDLSWSISDSLATADSTLSNLSVNKVVEHFLDKQFDIGFVHGAGDYKLVSIEIKNISEKTVSNVNIDTDYQGLYQYNDLEGNLHHGTYKGNIKLGELRPSSRVNLLIWTNDMIWFLRDVGDENTRISFDGGFITPDEKVIVSGVYASLSKRSFSSNLFFIFLSCFLFYTLYSGFNQIIKSSRKKENLEVAEEKKDSL